MSLHPASQFNACSLTRLVVLVAWLAAGGATVTALPQLTTGYSFPHLIERCPAETCPVGRWLACEVTPIRQRPGATQEIIGRVSRGGLFDVIDGALLVLQPGEVRVTRSIRQGANVYERGDVLSILGHFGEGVFAAVHRANLVDVEIFWPWRHGSGWTISGELVREEVTEFWLKTSVDARPGWVLNTLHDRASSGRDVKLVSGYGKVGPLMCPVP